MDRRSFIRAGTAAAASGIIMSKSVFADSHRNTISANKLAGGVFYTKEAPGRWKKKAGSHSPIIEKTDSGVRVITGHPMQANKHWIIKHVLLDSDFNFISENLFDPRSDTTAISNFTLPNNTGAVYALSVCNLHDTWVSMLEV